MKKTILLIFLVAILFYSFSYTTEKQNSQEYVPYPEGYRNWKHVKSGYRGPESEGFKLFGGFHHIYANDLAIQGYSDGKFPEGSVLVFDLLSVNEANDVIEENIRSSVDVMVKDSIKYVNTYGWGFERFKGDSKTERVLDENFRQLCVSCHVKQKEFVISKYRK